MRYPIKSMSGEVMNEAFMGFSGFYGDRCFAFKNSASHRDGYLWTPGLNTRGLACHHRRIKSL